MTGTFLIEFYTGMNSLLHPICSFFVYPSMFLSAFMYPSMFLSVFGCLSLLQSAFLSFCVSICFMFIYVFCVFYVSLYLWVSHFASTICLCVSFYVSICLWVSLFVSICLSVSFCASIGLSIRLSLFLSVYVFFVFMTVFITLFLFFYSSLSFFRFFCPIFFTSNSVWVHSFSHCFYLYPFHSISFESLYLSFLLFMPQYCILCCELYNCFDQEVANSNPEKHFHTGIFICVNIFSKKIKRQLSDSGKVHFLHSTPNGHFLLRKGVTRSTVSLWMREGPRQKDKESAPACTNSERQTLIKISCRQNRIHETDKSN